MRTLLVDGTNLFIRSYTVNPTLNGNGIPVGGVIGTLKSLRSIIRNLKPQKVIFVWDGPGGSVKKRKLFKEYKEGRRPRTIAGRHYDFGSIEKAKENKVWQIENLRTLISSLPVCQIITQNIEADDAIAYIVNNAEYFGHTSNIIATCDKDFYQLIGYKTVIYNPIKKTLLSRKGLIDETGIPPENWLFFKAINGDKSDNIPGVPGFGHKTIAKLFCPLTSGELTVENIKEAIAIQKDFLDCGRLNSTEKKSAERILKRYKTLEENIELIERNWKIMSLKDPLISLNAKEKLTEILLNFSPVLNKPQFYVDIMKLGGMDIQLSFFDEFHFLNNKL